MLMKVSCREVSGNPSCLMVAVTCSLNPVITGTQKGGSLKGHKRGRLLVPLCLVLSALITQLFLGMK